MMCSKHSSFGHNSVSFTVSYSVAKIVKLAAETRYPRECSHKQRRKDGME